MSDANWDIRRGGRTWHNDEFEQPIDLRPEKLEVHEGKLLWDDKERVLLLGLLLENLRADGAVTLETPQYGRRRSRHSCEVAYYNNCPVTAVGAPPNSRLNAAEKCA